MVTTCVLIILLAVVINLKTFVLIRARIATQSAVGHLEATTYCRCARAYSLQYSSYVSRAGPVFDGKVASGSHNE